MAHLVKSKKDERAGLVNAVYRVGYVLQILIPFVYESAYCLAAMRAFDEASHTGLFDLEGPNTLLTIYYGGVGVQFCMFVAETCLLIDAIRRIRATLSGRKGLQANESTMGLHACIFGLVNLGLLFYAGCWLLAFLT